MVAREPITKESVTSFVERMSGNIISIRNNAKDPRSAMRRDIPMIINMLYEEVNKRADGVSPEGLVVKVLKEAYLKTGDLEFEKLRTQVVDKVFIKG